MENNKNTNNQTETKQDTVTGDLSMIFDNFIKTGAVEKEKEVVPGFKIRLKVLNTGELLVAESIMNTNSAPSDIVARVRAASILSQAIMVLNGSPIERDDLDSNDIRRRRAVLYSELLKMPARAIHRAYEFYIECVNEQNSKYDNIGETIQEMQNF